MESEPGVVRQPPVVQQSTAEQLKPMAMAIYPQAMATKAAYQLDWRRILKVAMPRLPMKCTGNITVRGNDSRGIEAGSGSDGTVIATNKGTISTYGSRSASATFGSHGLLSFSQRGNATAENAAGGSIITRGQGATGMGTAVGFGETGVPDTVKAETINRGTVMSMDDGIWVYSTAGRAVLRNYGSVTAGENKTAVTADADGSAVAEVTIEGADTVTASGTDGIGVYAEAEQDTGSSTDFPITVDISDSSITAATAIQLSGQRASVSISDSQIRGNIEF